jgi:hypothetical protein
VQGLEKNIFPDEKACQILLCHDLIAPQSAEKQP